ncbi:MAG: hypothetical protein ACFE9N_11125 [Promethearchaeota archaeon]
MTLDAKNAKARSKKRGDQLFVAICLIVVRLYLVTRRIIHLVNFIYFKIYKKKYKKEILLSV